MILSTFIPRVCLLSQKVAQKQSLRISGEVFGLKAFVFGRTGMSRTEEGSKTSKSSRISRTVPRGKHWLSATGSSGDCAGSTSELSYRNFRYWLQG